MKVKELIEALQKENPEAVVMAMDECFYGEIAGLERGYVNNAHDYMTTLGKHDGMDTPAILLEI